MHPNYRSVAFLLSLGNLPLGCNGDDAKPTSTETETDGSSDTSATAGSTPSTTGDGASGTTPTTGDSQATGDDAETTGETDSLPPATDPTCFAFGDAVSACFPGPSESYASVCQYSMDMGLRVDGQGCAVAYEAYFACLSKLDCMALKTEEDLCHEENIAVESACPLLLEL